MGVNDSLKSKTGRFRVLTVSKLEERYEGHPSKTAKKKTRQRHNDSLQTLSGVLQNRVCPFCTITFERNTELNRHVKRKHLKPYKCGACSRTFGLQSDLDRHAATHYADNRFYACEWTGCQNKSFSRKQHLERHINSTHLKLDLHVRQNQDVSGSTAETVLRDSACNAKTKERHLAEQSSGIVKFLYVVTHEDLATIESLLAQNGVDINHTDINGRNALHIAAENDTGALITSLLSKGADASHSNRWGLNPVAIAAAQANEEALHAMLDFGCHDYQRNALSEACAFGQLKCVQLLLKSANEPYERADIGRCLYQAARNNHISIVKFLLETNTHISHLYRKLSICIAAAKGYLAMIEILLHYEERDSARRKALFEACEAGHVETVRLLLTHVSQPHDAAWFKCSQRFPLSLAAQENHIDLAMVLLDSGARPDTGPMLGFRSPLEEATFRSSLPLVRLFLQHINSSSEGLSHASRNNALAAASQGAKHDMIQFWLEQGADINDQNRNGHTALSVALQSSHTEAVQYLLEHGANPNHVDHEGRSALMLASEYTTSECMRTLLEHGANLFHQDSHGQTLLFYAARNSRSDCLQQLLGYGLLGVNHTDNAGGTALIGAVRARRDQCVQLLLDHGADCSHANNFGCTTLSEAIFPSGSKCLRVLLNSCDLVDPDLLSQVFQQALEMKRSWAYKPSEEILQPYAESRRIVLS